MLTRRDFVRRASAGVGAAAALVDGWQARVTAADGAARGSALDVAADEDYWRGSSRPSRSTGPSSISTTAACRPSPRVVHEAMKRYLDISNQAPAYHMWQVLEPNIETVRRRLAAEFGCDTEELAITRNASEALQIAQLGIDLKAGDEVVTTNQDYPRMLDTWQQRVRRDGIVAQADLVPRAAAEPGRSGVAARWALTPATKVIHFCHITNLTGQIFPVATSAARRARAASGPSWTARTRSRTSPSRWPTSSATTTARACTSGCSRPSAPASSTCGKSADRGALAAHARQRSKRPTTSASSRRSARTRRRCTTPSPRRWSSTMGSGARRRRDCVPGKAPRGWRELLTTIRVGAIGCFLERRSAARACLWTSTDHRDAIKHAEFQGLRMTPNVYTTLESDASRAIEACPACRQQNGARCRAAWCEARGAS